MCPTKPGSPSSVANAGPTPQNGSQTRRDRPSMERNSLASARVSSLSVCNLVEKYARLGSHRMLRPDSLTITLVSSRCDGKSEVRISSPFLHPIGRRSRILSSPWTPLSSITNLTCGWDCIFAFAMGWVCFLSASSILTIMISPMNS